MMDDNSCLVDQIRCKQMLFTHSNTQKCWGTSIIFVHLCLNATHGALITMDHMNPHQPRTSTSGFFICMMAREQPPDQSVCRSKEFLSRLSEAVSGMLIVLTAPCCNHLVSVLFLWAAWSTPVLCVLICHNCQMDGSSWHRKSTH